MLRGVESLDQELGHRTCGRFNKVKYCERTCRAKRWKWTIEKAVGNTVVYYVLVISEYKWVNN